MSSTVNASSVKVTVRTRSSALVAVIPTPGLQELRLVIGHDAFDIA
jgi:hypothetical protein